MEVVLGSFTGGGISRWIVHALDISHLRFLLAATVENNGLIFCLGIISLFLLNIVKLLVIMREQAKVSLKHDTASYLKDMDDQRAGQLIQQNRKINKETKLSFE